MRPEELRLDGMKAVLGIGPSIDCRIKLRKEFVRDHLAGFPAAACLEPSTLRARQVAGGDVIAQGRGGIAAACHLFADDDLYCAIAAPNSAAPLGEAGITAMAARINSGKVQRKRRTVGRRFAFMAKKVRP